MAEPVRSTAPGGGLDVFVEGGGPDAQLGLAVGGEEQIAARLAIFARLDIFSRLDRRVAEQFDKGFDYAVADAKRSSAGRELLEVPAINIPPGAQVLALVSRLLGDELAGVQLLFELEPHEGVRHGRSEELAVREFKRHGSPPG